MYLEAKEQAESGSPQPKQDNSDRAYYKRELDKQRGREGRVREQVSIDKFMEDIGRN